MCQKCLWFPHSKEQKNSPQEAQQCQRVQSKGKVGLAQAPVSSPVLTNLESLARSCKLGTQWPKIAFLKIFLSGAFKILSCRICSRSLLAIFVPRQKEDNDSCLNYSRFSLVWSGWESGESILQIRQERRQFYVNTFIMHITPERQDTVSACHLKGVEWVS